MDVYEIGLDSLFTQVIDTDARFFLFQSRAGCFGILGLET